MFARCSLAIRAVSTLALLALFSGCASYTRIANYPTPAKATIVTVAPKPMSKMSELPVGAYYDESKQIIISGHQKGLGWGMMFGLVGVLVADQANKSSAAEKFGNSANSSATDLATLAREVIGEELVANRAPGWKLGSASAELVISPYALFTVLESGKARLYAMVRAEIPGPGDEKKWSVRYFARAPGEFTIEGNDGWMSEKRFVDGMRTALRSALRVCMDDTAGKLTGTRKIKAKGVFPYMNTAKFELPFIVVQETGDSLVGRLAAGDVMVMAGTHVLDRADYQIVDGDFKDPRQ